MEYIKKLLNSQPTISFATFRDMHIVIANKGFNRFFETAELDIQNKILDVRNFLSVVNNEWIENMLSEPETPYLLKFYKKGIEHNFNIYLSISYIEEQCLYIYTMLDVSELERLRERELNQAKIVSIGELSLGLTHEVNTPLTYILGNIELMEMDIQDIGNPKLEKQFQENIDSIRDGGFRIQRIIKLLQEYTTLNESVGETVDINQAIYNSFQLSYNRSKHITNIYFNNTLISLKNSYIEEKFTTKSILKSKLEQVLLILINNSLDELVSSDLKFEERFIKIYVESIENNQNIISVEDNAGGIDEKIKCKIFDAFVSGKSQSGLGLGLNIAKKIIKDGNGYIRATNTSQGAIFRIVI